MSIRLPHRNSEVAHTIEHIGATYLRNEFQLKVETIYFGPMDCLTGFYLVLGKEISSGELVPFLTDLFRHVAEFDGEIPGASAEECGNYRLMVSGWRQKKRRVFLP